jgi:hypothetical protein
MAAGARTPEELETLMEDAFVLHDQHALAQLFDPDAMLVAGDGLPEARGRRQIAQVTARMSNTGRLYVADPRRVLQARDTALIVAGHAINVVRRADDGSWRYAIAVLDAWRPFLAPGAVHRPTVEQSRIFCGLSRACGPPPDQLT